jgi:hypothetical protein
MTTPGRGAPPRPGDGNEPIRSPRGRLVGELGFLLEVADRAPSPLNVRPWRLRGRDGGLDLMIDIEKIQRRGPASLRQCHIACGTALFNLRVAVGHLGLEARVELLPDHTNPALVARVEPGPARSPLAGDEDLFTAIMRRRTRREPFGPAELPEDRVAGFLGSVSSEGAVLLPMNADRLRVLDRLLSDADAASPVDPARDLGMRAAWSGTSEGPPVYGLCTFHDHASDWLRAGQGLMRLLLTTSADDIQARLFTLALEDPDRRERVRRLACAGRHPQLIVQLGYAGKTPPSAPRKAPYVSRCHG